MQSKITKSNFYLLAFLVLIFSIKANFSLAQTANENAITQQDKIILNNQAITEGEEHQQEIKKAEERSRLQLDYDENDQMDGSHRCAIAKEIRLHGVSILTIEEQKNLIKAYLNQCLTNNAVSNLANDIMNYYKEKGYLAAKVVLKNKKIKNGILELQIYEGVIEEIIINQNTLNDKRQAKMAFGNIIGKILYINDLNQGLSQINRLSSNKAKMEIVPGSSEGKVKIIINNQIKNPMHLGLTYDNLGRKSVGEKRLGAHIAYDNLLSLNDKIEIGYLDNAQFSKERKYNQLANGSVNIPYGYYNYSLSYVENNFINADAGTNINQKQTGYSTNKTAAITRLVTNSKKLKLSLIGAVTVKRAASYLDYDKVDGSQRRLTVMNLGVSTISNLDGDITIITKPSYVHGLSILNASRDEGNLSNGAPHAEYEAYKFYGYASKKFDDPISKTKATFSMEFDSQLARQSLYGTETFLVGGRDSVRGFKNNVITGDSGYYLRNKLTYDLGAIILPKLSDASAKNFSWLHKTTISPFYDYGYVKNYGGRGDGHLSGTGLRGEYNDKKYKLIMTYAWGLHHSALINSSLVENRMFYLEAGMNLDLL